MSGIESFAPNRHTRLLRWLVVTLLLATAILAVATFRLLQDRDSTDGTENSQVKEVTSSTEVSGTQPLPLTTSLPPQVVDVQTMGYALEVMSWGKGISGALQTYIDLLVEDLPPEMEELSALMALSIGAADVRDLSPPECFRDFHVSFKALLDEIEAEAARFESNKIGSDFSRGVYAASLSDLYTELLDDLMELKDYVAPACADSP